MFDVQSVGLHRFQCFLQYPASAVKRRGFDTSFFSVYSFVVLFHRLHHYRTTQPRTISSLQIHPSLFTFSMDLFVVVDGKTVIDYRIWLVKIEFFFSFPSKNEENSILFANWVTRYLNHGHMALAGCDPAAATGKQRMNWRWPCGPNLMKCMSMALEWCWQLMSFTNLPDTSMLISDPLK